MNEFEIRTLLTLRPMSQNENLETLNLGFGWFTYSAIRNLKPNNVLIIGSGYGYIPAIAALACADNNNGIVDFVDAGYAGEIDGFNKSWGGVGIWKNNGLDQFNELPRVKEYLRLHIATDVEFAAREDIEYSFIYIDADHSYEGTKRTYELFWPKLQLGGIMIFHDVLVEDKYDGWPDFGVARFWKELNKGITVNVWPGLGILSK